MKKNMKYFVMAAIALVSMSACTNEMDEQKSTNSGELQPVQFQMSFASTRTVTDAATRTTSWKTGDAIGIFAYNAGTETAIATNAKYVLGSDDSWKAEAGSEIYPEAAIDYYAYYPYQEGMTDPTKISLSALVDQSAASGDDYGKSDVLASQSKNVVVGQNTVKLTFKHMFAMVEVKIEGDKVTKQPTKVELKGVKLATTLNLKTAEPAATINQDATAQDITMYYLTNPNVQTNVYSFRAVVPAQTIAANTPLVAIYAPDDAGKTYTMQHPAEVSYNVGVFRQLNVNIGSAKVSLTIPKGDLTIDPWTPSDPIEGEGGEIVTPVISPLAGILTEIINDKTGVMAATEGWYKLLRKTDEPNVVFSTNDDSQTTWGKAAQLKYTSVWDTDNSKAVNNSYYIAAISYLHKSPMEISQTYIYKITAKIKATQNEKNENCKLVFMVRNATYDKSFLVSAVADKFADTTVDQATTVNKAPTTADTWEEYTFYVDFSQKSVTNGSIKVAEIATKILPSETADYAGFDLRVYTNSPATKDITSVTADVSVSDVSIEPYVAPIP